MSAPDLIDTIAKDRSDWLVDAVATATQDRRFLRGDPAEDEVATEAILLNGEKAIRIAIGHFAEACRADTVNADLLAALKEARRAIGDHFAPNDCYATGPMTGDPYRDLIECPACSAIAMYDAAIARAEAQP